MNKKILLIAIAAVVLVGGWYAFRPERLFVDQTVNESAVSLEGAMILASGEFHPVSHDGKGKASVYQLADGKKVLRFTEFETSNGPDVHVYLVAANDASDDATVTTAGFIQLGPIKGNKGDQNYELPGDVDLMKYRAVTIWCERFSKNFATAALN